MEDDDRPDEIINRVPNDVIDDVNEVSSLIEMWLNPRSMGTTLLQFYPNFKLIMRQLRGSTAFQQSAILFKPTGLYDPTTRSIPTRLSTPLSILESVYESNGGIIGLYKSNTIPKESKGRYNGLTFLIPNIILIICTPLSSNYLKQLAEWTEGISYAVASGEPDVIEALILDHTPPNNYKFSKMTNVDTLVIFIKNVTSSNYFIFPLILIGTTADAKNAVLFLDDDKWELDQYGLYEQHT